MNGPVRTEIVTEFERLETFAADWDRLWREHPRPSVFMGLPWRRAAWRATRAPLFAPVVFRGETVVGILPLALEETRLRFLGGPWADYSDLLVARGEESAVAEAVLSSLLESSSRWRECLLENLPEDAALLAGLSQVPEAVRGRTHLAPGATCPTLLLGGDRDAALDALVGKKSLRQRDARLGRLGELRFLHVETRAEARRRLEGLFDQHAARWAMAGEKSPFLHGETRAFYEGLIDELDPASELRFSALLVDGRAAAYHLGFESGGTFTLYKPTFDVDFWDHSPGDVLLRRLFEYVRGRPVKEFDFTRGDEAYKSRFANHSRRNQTLRLLPPGAAGVAAGVRLRARGRMRERTWITGPLRRLRTLGARVRGALGPSGRRRVREWLHAREEVVVWVARPGLPGGGAHGSIAVERAGLLDLALLESHRTETPDAERLGTARFRLKRGESAWIARGARGIEVFWSAPRSEIVLGPARIAFPSEGETIHDRWPVGSELAPSETAAALREIAKRAEVGEVRLAAPVSPGPAHEAGFRPTHRLGFVRTFGRTRRTWVRDEGTS